jgi:hypothetical protein
MRLAFEAYCSRASATRSENAKEFVASQAACRAALAHFMLLIRLSERLSRRRKEAVPGSGDDEDLDNMILEARAALDKELV